MQKAFLLAMDGSQEAMWAADLAALLASKTGSKLTVQTVVNSQAVWKLIGQELPGIIGSGPYLAAYQSVQTILKSLAETLVTACEARFSSELSVEMVIDDGNVKEEICRRAEHHDLLIIGHQEISRFDNQFRHGHMKQSLCQQVAEACATPILIVQRPCHIWERARLVVCEETYNTSVLNYFLKLKQDFDIEAQIVCTGRLKTISQLVDQVQADLPTKSNVAVIGKKLHEIEDFYSDAAKKEKESLLVITTSSTKIGKYLCTGQALDHFVRDLGASATLLLPPKQPDCTEQQVISAGNLERA